MEQWAKAAAAGMQEQKKPNLGILVGYLNYPRSGLQAYIRYAVNELHPWVEEVNILLSKAKAVLCCLLEFLLLASLPMALPLALLSWAALPTK